ncbi:MAG: acetyl-CoA carboxylase biotin carboxyl carrier protein [Betaproteobacteria bacterium]|nr:acetyl-CoA carboxylase biotin carboxyl carrier protein [Betaproteobacteria bacterium]
MDLRKLKAILEVFENSDIDEIELVEGEERIRMVKNVAAPPAAVQPVAAPATVVAPAAAPVAVAAADASAAPAQAATDQEEEDAYVFNAPMVGTFYSASAPDQPPFVKIGDSVSEGDVVCIIEAMKLMNELRAPVSGKIVAIHASNGEPVAYGDRLMSIG